MKNPLVVSALVCALAASAGASDEAKETTPRAELFAGYSLARESGSNVHGWAASLQYNLSSWLAIGAETSAHHEKDHGATVTRSSYLLGPRLSKRGGKFTPFVYALGGIERTKGEVKVGSISISDSESETAVALGGGVDIELSHRFALAIEADDLLVRSNGKTHGTLRFSTGLVFHIGEK